MSKIKTTILLTILAIIVGISLFFILPAQQKQAYNHKVILAKETRKVVGRLMIDLRNAKESSLQDVPADGQWHGRIAFINMAEGAVEYMIRQGRLVRVSQGVEQEVALYINSLKLRRNGKNPNLLEVRIEAKNQSQLQSNFKLRLKS